MQQQLDFKEIYNTYSRKLYNVAFRLTSNETDAQDVLQETFLNAYKGFGDFRGQSSVGTWLYRITINSAYRFMQKRQGHPFAVPVPEDRINEGGETARWMNSHQPVEDQVVSKDIREMCMQLFLNCIPKKQRIAFVLRALVDLPIREIADIMGITETSAKQNVFRAKEHLRAYTDGRCSFFNPDYPCKCSYWVEYTRKHGKSGLIPKSDSEGPSNEDVAKLVKGEFRYVEKLARMYEDRQNTTDFETFSDRLKQMIAENELKIFS